MVSMKTAKCSKCGGIVFKLVGKASKLCHDTCLECRAAEREAFAAEADAQERRRLETEEMDRHFTQHPHG